MHERSGGGHTDLTSPPQRHDLVVLPPDALAVLADVREEGGLFLLDDRRDVHVGVRQEALSLTAAVDLNEVEARRRQAHPRTDRADACDLIMCMRVNCLAIELHDRTF